MPKIDEQTIEDLKAKHGEVVHLVDPETRTEVVARKPPRAAYKRFRSMAFDPKKQADAAESLMVDCVVYPSRDEWNAMLEQYPALAETFAPEVLKLAGASQSVDAKKY
jgi:hypothetical protein